jgi:hypothetical protein
VTNALAYYGTELIKTVKSFMIQDPDVSHINDSFGCMQSSVKSLSVVKKDSFF